MKLFKFFKSKKKKEEEFLLREYEEGNIIQIKNVKDNLNHFKFIENNKTVTKK